MTQPPVIQTPAPAQAAPGSGSSIVTPQMVNGTTSTAPMTARDVAALLARRSELSMQLNSADGRRRELSRLARNVDGADKAGLEQRIGVLDARISGIEGDIAEVGRQLASPQAALAATQQPFSRDWGRNASSKFASNIAPITIVFTLFVLGPIALAVARRIWRRASAPVLPQGTADSQRLERMEQAVEAIAIEVERVSEGQRFVTRLLSEAKGGAAVGAGQAMRVPVKQSTPV